MVYDCFTFFNELDLLEIRLNILNEVVDFFVIVEGTRTFTNKGKQLCYEANKKRYAPFVDKIIYIKVDDYPEYHGDPWVFEKHQRNAIMRGLGKCSSHDRIIISDIDEICSPESIRVSTGSNQTIICKQNYYNFYVNMCYRNETQWYGSINIPYEKMTSPEDIRRYRQFAKYYSSSNCVRIISKIKKMFYLLTCNLKKYEKFKRICTVNSSTFVVFERGGWHFSYVGGINNIIKKIQSYSHQENNTKENNDPVNVQHRISNGTFNIKNSGDTLEVVPIDATYPAFLLENIEKYNHLVFKNETVR